MRYESTWYPFTGHPGSDSCWSLSAGPDGRIYAAACCELSPGQTAKLVRYNDETDSLDYLLDLDEVVDDPRDSGRATQCKIHYSFAPSMSDGILYMATHLSGPPIDRLAYCPWSSWHDPERCFRGSALVAFDTRNDEVLWWDTLFPKEGSRCMAYDEGNGLIYSTSYPRDHLFVYDLSARTRRDLGRIGSVNSQAMFMDSRHRVWTASDYGRFVRYDPAKDQLETSPSVLPHNPVFQTGWHNTFYDVVAAPDAPCVYAAMWIAQARLLRIWPEEGEWGRVEDLGPLTQERDTSIPYNTFLDHCGGLAFAADGQLYFVASRWTYETYEQASLYEKKDDVEGVVWRLDPDTLEREEVAVLERPGASAHYVTRAAVDRHGDLFFGSIGKTPVGIFKLHIPEDRKRENVNLPIRMWG